MTLRPSETKFLLSNLPKNSYFDRDDWQADPQAGHEAGDEDQRNDDHDDGSGYDGLDGLGQDGQVLIDVDEERLEDSDGELVGGIPSANVSQFGDHPLLKQWRVDLVTLE